LNSGNPYRRDNSALEVQNDSVSKDIVTVVIPTLNEEEAIGMVLDEVMAEGYRNILVVDGYSKDRTVDIAKSGGGLELYIKMALGRLEP